MARVHKRKARKDYPDHGIKKGDEYYFAQIKTGPRSSRIIRQISPIKPQQLTSSAFKSAVYDFAETAATISDIEGAREYAESIRELGNEQQEKLDNMPDGLREGDTGQLLQERLDACEQAADEIEQICDEWEQAESEKTAEITEWEEELTNRQEAFDEAESDDDKDEAQDDLTTHEDEKPEEFDPSEFITNIQEISIDA